MTGYTRQSSFTDGDTVEAADHNGEYNQLVSTFNATTGHTHGGATGEGAPIAASTLSGLGTGVATFLATPTSANLAAALTDETGTGSVVLATSPILVTPNIGTPSAAVLTNATGLPISTGVAGLGSGVATFLANPISANLVTALSDETGTGTLVFNTSPTLVTPILGTPTSGTLTNCTGLPAAGVVGTALVAAAIGTTVQAYDADLTTWSGITPAAGIGTFLATPSSANLIAAVTDETGTGALVFATSPTLVTPALGTPVSVVLTNATGLPISSGLGGAGTGVLTALAVNVGSSGAVVTFNGAGGTPSSLTLTNATGLPAAGVTGTAAILGANTFTGAQILSDQEVSRAMLIDCGMTYLDKGNSSTSTQTIDYTAGSHQKITATGNFTIALSNWPPSGNFGAVLVEATNFGAYTVTFPTINWVKPDGTTTTSVSTWLAANTGRTAFQTSGTEFFILWTRDGGTTPYGKFV